MLIQQLRVSSCLSAEVWKSPWTSGLQSHDPAPQTSTVIKQPTVNWMCSNVEVLMLYWSAEKTLGIACVKKQHITTGLSESDLQMKKACILH